MSSKTNLDCGGDQERETPSIHGTMKSRVNWHGNTTTSIMPLHYHCTTTTTASFDLCIEPLWHPLAPMSFTYPHCFMLLPFLIAVPPLSGPTRDLNETWRIYSYGYNLHNQEEYAELKKAADAATLMRPTIQSDVDEDDTTEATAAATGGWSSQFMCNAFV